MGITHINLRRDYDKTETPYKQELGSFLDATQETIKNQKIIREYLKKTFFTERKGFLTSLEDYRLDPISYKKNIESFLKTAKKVCADGLVKKLGGKKRDINKQIEEALLSDPEVTDHISNYLNYSLEAYLGDTEEYREVVESGMINYKNPNKEERTLLRKMKYSDRFEEFAASFEEINKLYDNKLQGGANDKIFNAVKGLLSSYLADAWLYLGKIEYKRRQRQITQLGVDISLFQEPPVSEYHQNRPSNIIEKIGITTTLFKSSDGGTLTVYKNSKGKVLTKEAVQRLVDEYRKK